MDLASQHGNFMFTTVCMF